MAEPSRANTGRADSLPGTPTGSGSAEQLPLVRLPVRTPLVGRRQELSYLQAAYDAAASSEGGRLILLSGEPGVGKTRLAREVGQYAERRGGRFLEGYYLRAGTAAYGPW